MNSTYFRTNEPSSDAQRNEEKAVKLIKLIEDIRSNQMQIVDTLKSIDQKIDSQHDEIRTSQLKIEKRFQLLCDEATILN